MDSHLHKFPIHSLEKSIIYNEILNNIFLVLLMGS